MRHSFIAPTLSLAFSALSLLSIELAAQNPQDSSVADAARQAREQKKAASKPAKVITNDALPAAPKPDSTNSPGSQPAPSPDPITQPMTNTETGSATSSAAAETEAGPAVSATASKPGTAAETDELQSKPELAALKQQLTDQQKEVDLLMRLYTLNQEAFLSNPDHAKDPQGKAKLEAQEQEIHAKVAEVARLKVKLDAIAPGESAKPVTPKP